MVAKAHSQSLDDFQDRSAETFERLNRTGEAEALTVDGQVKAVLLSPAVFDELTRQAFLAYDAASIRRSVQEIQDGKGQEATAFFTELRGKLLAMKESQSRDAAE